jgi:hypothetical protein
LPCGCPRARPAAQDLAGNTEPASSAHYSPHDNLAALLDADLADQIRHRAEAVAGSQPGCDRPLTAGFLGTIDIKSD